MATYMKNVIFNLIEEAHNLDLGYFIYDDKQKETKDYVFEMNEYKRYSISDFVDMVMHERLRVLTMLER